MDVDTFIFLLCVIFAAVGLFLVIRHLVKQAAAYYGPPTADLARAIQIVWVQVYKQALSTIPALQWITGSALNCGKGNGWFSSSNGVCVAGETYVDQRLCQIAWNSTYKLSTCSLAHELCHYYMFVIGLPPDPNHTGPYFANGGIKDQAVQALTAAGL